MKHSLDQDRSFLKWHNRRGIAHVISRDYRWFKEQYLPAIERLERAGMKKDRLLLGWCYYMIGDVHDFNQCPKAAIKAYRKSYEVYPNGEALREMGNMYERMGYYKKAKSLLKKALQIDAKDELAIMYYNDIDTSGTSLFSKNDQNWQARELLAQDNPAGALKLLDKKRSVQAMQIKACAYGILNDTEAALEQWRRIAGGKEKIEVAYADWFFMTDAVWNHAKFWEKIAICARQNRFAYGIWYMFDSLYDTGVIFPAKQRRNSKADLMRCNECNYLEAQYHIARIRRDVKLAGRLAKQYPKWKEIKALYRKLSS
ncbi:MAG: tetratricopeptide repeat protein [Anaerohalosphaeraceae bacterium]